MTGIGSVRSGVIQADCNKPSGSKFSSEGCGRVFVEPRVHFTIRHHQLSSSSSSLLRATNLGCFWPVIWLRMSTRHRMDTKVVQTHPTTTVTNHQEVSFPVKAMVGCSSNPVFTTRCVVCVHIPTSGPALFVTWLRMAIQQAVSSHVMRYAQRSSAIIILVIIAQGD
jgi:hypothetical protein